MGLMAAEEGGLAAVLVLAAAVEDLEAVGAVDEAVDGAPRSGLLHPAVKCRAPTLNQRWQSWIRR